MFEWEWQTRFQYYAQVFYKRCSLQVLSQPLNELKNSQARSVESMKASRVFITQITPFYDWYKNHQQLLGKAVKQSDMGSFSLSLSYNDFFSTSKNEITPESAH